MPSVKPVLIPAFAVLCFAQRAFQYDPAVVPSKPAIPRGFALVVGIDAYKNLPPNKQLRYSVADAESVYTTLISVEGGNFPAENVHRLLGADATLENLRRELEVWLPSVARPDDRIVIFFAGHGFMKDGKGYLAPHDVDHVNLERTGYPMASLAKVMQSIPSKWKLLLTDACHSGAVAETGSEEVVNALQDLNRTLLSFTASATREFSHENKNVGGGHGLFTYFVVKGLEGEADDNCDGKVTAGELIPYVKDNVRGKSNGKQNPGVQEGAYDRAMLLSFNPLKVCASTPEVNGTLIFISDEDVDIYIDGKHTGKAGKNSSLQLPGLKPGPHVVQGIRQGYESDGPRVATVFPGNVTTVTIRCTVPARPKRSAGVHFEHGVEAYNRGYEKNYRGAAKHFEAALSADPNYAEAALFLGRCYNALFEHSKAKDAVDNAIKMRPNYWEARTSYAGMLVDLGDLDEAVRQLNQVRTQDPRNAMVMHLLAQVFVRKKAFAEAITAARQSVNLNPAHPESHFWLAQALRLGSGELVRAGRGESQVGEARDEYLRYLKLSDFDSTLAGKLHFHVFGYLLGMGKKQRPTQEDIWKDFRAIAYGGLGDCERMLDRTEAAIAYFQRSLHFDPLDPVVHYALAFTHMRMAEQMQSVEPLAAALHHFGRTIELNPNLAESTRAQSHLARIRRVLLDRKGAGA
jgi:tetratricopeptide (TPR) repeat protein